MHLYGARAERSCYGGAAFFIDSQYTGTECAHSWFLVLVVWPTQRPEASSLPHRPVASPWLPHGTVTWPWIHPILPTSCSNTPRRATHGMPLGPRRRKKCPEPPAAAADHCTRRRARTRPIHAKRPRHKPATTMATQSLKQASCGYASDMDGFGFPPALFAVSLFQCVWYFLVADEMLS